MKTNSLNDKTAANAITSADETVYLPDECGDTMWDAVLEQEVKACDVKEISTNAASLLINIHAVQECDARMLHK
ncbi:MAG: hypothetical protein ABI921_02375 [Panacibacter sp.]